MASAFFRAYDPDFYTSTLEMKLGFCDYLERFEPAPYNCWKK
jgi:hypothetical protein